MALRLARKLGRSRRIELGYGVWVDLRPFSYAEFKECEATAMRMALDGMSTADATETAAMDDEDLRPEVEEATRGRFASFIVHLVLVRFGEGWGGIEDEDGAPVAMNAGTIAQVLEAFPGVAQALHIEMLQPFQAVDAEGNVSAPLPNTATAVG